MGLKAQLAIVAAVSLLLPWAGCEYLKETEVALRQSQQTLLLSSARGIAAGLVDAARNIRQPEADASGQLFLTPLTKRPVLDGFASEWTPAAPQKQPLRGSASVRFLSGEFAGLLYLMIDSGETQTRLFGVSATDDAGTNHTFAFSADAPGPLIANRRSATIGSRAEPRVRGYWAETSTGPHLEIQMPVTMVLGGLGLFVESANGKRLAGSYDSALPPAPIARSPALERVIARYQQPGIRLRVVDRQGWIRAASGALANPDFAALEPDSTLLTRFYRRMLRDVGITEALRSVAGGQDTNRYVRRALGGEPSDAWLRGPGRYDSGAIVAAAAPIQSRGSIHGAVVMNQNSASLLFITNNALTRLATLTLAATLVTVLVLLAYATWLSFRIRRLSQATDQAMDAKGALATRLPSSRAGDEIGSLSRSLATLLRRIGNYNDYLRNLAGRLSHELRTPMAVVSSSLDNLESESLTPAQQEYAERARDGIERLRRLVHAMSEATRVEQAATAATMLEFDLGAVIASAIEGYRDAYPHHAFRFDHDAARKPYRGAPDLLVQLLDKLVENAVSFTESGETLTVALVRQEQAWQLSVSNPGPPLPEAMGGRLFESLVSVRESGGDSHLGFGLYIARLIAEAHGGSLAAANLDDGSGVCFSVTLPG